MRHGTQNRRPRNKGHNNGGHGNNGGQGIQHHNGARRGTYNRNQIFDSNGPEVRIRGTAHQVCEKYLALAKDASSAGDLVLAESYLQHAEHYQRIINSWNEEFRDMSRTQPDYGAQDQQPQPATQDDLALPISILGGDVKVQDVRPVAQAETILENA